MISVRRHVGALLTVALMLALGSASIADAYVYWTNQDTNTIGRANLDSSAVNQTFITGADWPTGVAVDGTHIYWANHNGNTIGRANLDGSAVNQTFITGAGAPRGVAVDGTHVYWTNMGNQAIGRANLDGSDANLGFITGASNPEGVAVDGAHVFWTNTPGPIDAIGRANLDGSDANQSFITAASSAMGVAVDGTHVYWSNTGSPNTIGRANLDGSDQTYSFLTADAVWGVAVDSTYVYWASHTAAGAIGRANLTGGSAVNPSFITGATYPQGVAVDPLTPDTTPPQTTIASGANIATTDPTPTFTFTSSEAGSTFECRVDSAAFAVCTSPHTTATLADGAHTFQVRAIDPAGNTDQSPDIRSFTVDTASPRATLSGKTTQKAGKLITTVVACPNEACTATAIGTVRVPGAKNFKLGKATKTIAKGGRATLKLKIPKQAQQAITHALRKGKKITAKITVNVRDVAGNTTTKRRTIKLRK